MMGGPDFMNREGNEMKYVIRGIAIAVSGCLLLLVVAEPGLTDENEKCGGYLGSATQTATAGLPVRKPANAG